MATTFDKAREILNNTIPSDVDEVKVIELPEGGLHIEVTIHRPPAAITGQGKWARVAQRLSEEAPLTGMSEEFLNFTRRFRDSFTMKPFLERDFPFSPLAFAKSFRANQRQQSQ